MPPKSKRAVKAPKPSKPTRATRTPRAPKPQNAEPEVLGDDTHDGEREPLLDALAYVLDKSDDHQAPARKAIVAAFGGTCDAAREHEVLLMVKRDARFRVIADSGRHGNRIALVADGSSQVSGPVDAGEQVEMTDDGTGTGTVTGTASSEPAQQTLGALVADAQGRPLRIPWPHDIGSHVLLLTDGHPPRKATIKNIHATGSSAFYDLTTESGGETNDVPAYRIGRDLDAEGELETMRMRMAALERHIDRGANLAQRIVTKQAEERTQAETLSKLRKEIEALYGELADHERSEPGQTDIRDVVGDGSGTPRGEKMAKEPSDDEDVLADGAARKTSATLAETGLTLDDIEAARFEQATASTGKPQKAKPVSAFGQAWLLTDVQGGVAVMLPVLDVEDWTHSHQEQFGHPLSLPSEQRCPRLAAGGRLCGMPIRVGRAVRYLGADQHALLVSLPVEEKAVGKDAAAGA